MKTIGLLGGMSWESPAEYYRLLNELTRERLGGLHSARVLLYSVDFAEIEELQVAGAGTRPARCSPTPPRAAGGGRRLAADLHQHHAQGRRPGPGRVDIPLLHIADTTAAAVTRRGLRRVGLLGTAFTMEQDFYRDRLAGRRPATCSSPTPTGATGAPGDLRGAVPRRRPGRVPQAYQAVIGDLVAAGAEGIISAAPRSSCSSGRKDKPGPACSRPPGCMPRPP